MGKDNFVIAIDGFSSCGKSTVAKALAKELNFVFVDSGAMYRAVTLYFLRHAIDLQDNVAVANALEHIQIDFVPRPDAAADVLLNGEDVSEEIRQMSVSEKVSEVSAVKEVRTAMVAQQQQLGSRRNIVMDGRDIGTTVFPEAEVRAIRRYKELMAKGEATTLEEVRENLAHRDHIDSTREESPLRQATDAIVLDNSTLTQEEQLKFVITAFSKREK
jgi:cytidylate kinase